MRSTTKNKIVTPKSAWSELPNAAHCYRVQATPGEWQAYSAFEYTVTIDGVLCDFYWPMAVCSTIPNIPQEK